jgi:hypothetical protein
MFKFKKIDNEDRVKHMELKKNRTKDVAVKDTSITLKSAFRLKGMRTGNGNGISENFGVSPGNFFLVFSHKELYNQNLLRNTE